MKNVDKALKFDPKNVDLLNQKQMVLTKTIASTEKELGILKEAQRQYIESGKDITGSEYLELESKIGIVSKSLENLKAQQSNFSAEVQAMGAKLSGFGDAAANVGDKLATAVSVPIVAAGTAMAGMSIKFEDSMAKVATIADTSQVPLDDLSAAITQLSNETGISADEIADNVYNAISAGQQTGDAVNFVANSTKLAKAGFADAGASLDLLTTIMNAYGLEADQVNHVSDALIQTQNLGKTTVGELSSAMGKVIPTANAMGVNIDQLCAGYALMTANGVATAESTTYMNSMLNELGKTGSTTDQVLRDKTGKSFSQLMESGASLADVLQILDGAAKEDNKTLSDMFSSSEAGKAGLILLGDSADKFNQTLGEMQNSTGAADDAFDKLQTSSYSIQKAFNMVMNTFRELGDTLMERIGPVIENVCQRISDFCKWFSNLDDGAKNTIISVGMVAAAIGPLISVFGRVTGSIGELIKYFGRTTTVGGKLLAFFKSGGTVTGLFAKGLGALLSPVTLVVGAIAGLVAAFVTLWNTNEDFRNAMTEIWDSIVGKVQEFCQGIKDRIDSLGIDFSKVTAEIQTIWQGLCDFLAPIFEGVWKQIENILTAAMDIILGIFDTFAAGFNGDWEGFWDGIQSIWDACWTYINDSVKNVLDTILSCVSEFLSWFGIEWEPNLEQINQIWQDIWGSIGNFIDECIRAIQELIAGFIDLFNGDWDGFCSHLSEAWNILWEGVKQFASDIWTEISQIGQDIWNGILSFLTGLWDSLMSKCQEVWTNIQNTVSGIWNSVLSNCQNTWDNIRNAIVGPIESAYSSVQSTFSGIYNWISDKINSARNAVGNAIESIKGFFNFSVSWPNIPMPHPYISPRGWDIGDLLHGSIPSIGIDWYAKAMPQGIILDQPTVLGMLNGKLMGAGEAGPEAIVGVNSLKQMINEAVMRAVQTAGKQPEPYDQQPVDFDYDRLARIMIGALSGIKTEVVTNLNGKTLARESAPFIDRELSRLAKAR